MNCKKCTFCNQVSRQNFEVKCNNERVSKDPNAWVVEPEYCKFYLKKGASIWARFNYRIALDLEDKI